MPSVKLRREVFLSCTLADNWGKNIRDRISEVFSSDQIIKKKIKLIRSEDMGFPREKRREHLHDHFLKQVSKTPEFLLIIGEKAGSKYEGGRKDYRDEGLTLVHAEARMALSKKKEFTCFILKETQVTYDLWLRNNEFFKKNFLTGSVDLEVLHLVKELYDRGICKYFFDDKHLLRQIRALYKRNHARGSK